MSDSELNFSVAVKEVQIIYLNQKWKSMYSTIRFPPSTGLDEEQFLYFFLWLSNGLFFMWSRAMADDDRKAIQIPDKDLVAKYSLPVVYYVAGWTLQRTSLALLVAQNERYPYQTFANSHKITAQSAKDELLPCELVELRQKKCLMFPDKPYFDFIKLVESIYVHNLTVGMMMAFVDGDLMKAIDAKIKSCDKVWTTFGSLFSTQSLASEIDKRKILHYILERYIKMRGRWFVKHVRTSQNKSIGEVKVEAQPTRAKVANQHVQSEAIAKEKAIWTLAGKSVVNYKDDEPIDENSHAMNIDTEIEINNEY